MIVIVFFSAVSGGFFSYLLVSEQLNNLQSQVNVLQEHIDDLQIIQNVTYVFGDTAFLSELYNEIKDSIVTILGVVVQNTPWGPSSSQVQGSGFVYNYDGQMVIITNFHVVNDAVDITVTFTDGNGYGATVLGLDPYADLAVLSTEAPQYEYKPLEIVSSSTLQVGNLIIALGSPYGLAGSMTTGIVSQLGRSIREETTGGFSIANVIQISAPINPGNSGGPLLNYQGQVVGITTAIVSDSQGLGFAIPSNTILREIKALVEEGHYEGHSWLGVVGIDMDFDIATAMETTVTYGWLIIDVVNGGPADEAGLRGGTQQAIITGRELMIGGDIIVAFNETRIRNIDDLATYLEEYTLPGHVINVEIMRNRETLIVPVELGTRPPL